MAKECSGVLPRPIKAQGPGYYAVGRWCPINVGNAIDYSARRAPGGTEGPWQENIAGELSWMKCENFVQRISRHTNLMDAGYKNVGVGLLACQPINRVLMGH